MFAREWGKRLGLFLPTLAATALVCRDWWNGYLLGGHSSNMDYFRMAVLDEAVRQGDWWPRFAEAFYSGHGSLLFHYYAPLTYWFSEIFMRLGTGAPIAIKLTMGLTALLSGVFVALLARDLFGPWAGAAAGPFYVLAPYHLTDMLARHAFGEAVAFAWVPLALWGGLGAVRDRSIWRMAAAAVGCAFLLLTHNITAMISAPLLAAFWLYLTIVHRREGWRGPALGAIGGVSGLLLAAFFWWPALAETELVWSKRSLTEEYFVYWNHFVYFKQFFTPYWGHGGSFPGWEKDGMAFQLGLAHWAGVLFSAGAFALWKKHRGLLVFWWGALLWALLMCHEVSLPVWRSISLLAYVQFPWRFLLLAALAASVIAGAAAQWLAELRLRWPYVALVLAALVVASPLAVYFPYTFSKHMIYDVARAKYPRYFTEELPKRLKDKRYQRLERLFTPEEIRNHSINATARDDYLPKTVRALPKERALDEATATPGAAGGLVRLAPRRYALQVAMENDGVARLSRFWHPGWRAWVDGRETPTFPDGDAGLLGVRVPAGEHEVRFAFVGLPRWRWAWAVSAVGAALLAGAMIAFRRRDPATTPTAAS